MEGLVKISELVDYLKSNDLVIVSKSEFATVTEEDLNLMRARMLKKKSVTLAEIVSARLLPLTSKQGVMHWINNHVIKPEEVYKDQVGKIYVLTSAIKRLGYV
jgi:Ni2+-binding GTPase involved in maturation of urease and hydrogenase